MADYSKGKIYTIRYKLDPSFIYVGSTIRTLNHRWNQHKWSCQNEPKCPLHYKINETNDIDNWYIDLYENYACKSKRELIERESQVSILISTLNTRIETRSKSQYSREHYDPIKQKERRKRYNDNNRYDITCECGCNIRRLNLSRHLKSNKHQKLLKNNVIVE